MGSKKRGSRPRTSRRVDQKPQKPQKSQHKRRSVSVELLSGEEVTFKEDAPASGATDEELNSRYAKGESRIVTESARYNLAGILTMLEERVDGEFRYQLDPEYQRRHRWSVERKSKLIESFLMNVPVPPVFLYERDLARFEVMDGRQRLTTLSEFYADKFELAGLEYWPELHGRTCSQLPSKVRDGIDRRYISAIILLKETAKDEEEAARLKKMVFERLNSGGVKLSGQETRNAIYDGPLNQLCLELSEQSEFKQMWGIPDEPGTDDDTDDADDAHEPEQSPETTGTPSGKKMFAKMADVELVLRFFAYRHIESFNAGLNRITTFLDRFLIEGNRFTRSVLDSYRAMFLDTVGFLFQALGTDAFSPIGRPRARPSKIIYDPMMYVASMMEPHERARLLDNEQIFRGELESLYEREADLFAGRRTNTSDALEREARMMESYRKALQLAGDHK